MSEHILGLHHITAISGPPQPNLDFMSGVLGQRLIKRTVNFDAPDTYHLYYGDEVGSPGTIMTYFPFVDAAPGRAGAGMAVAVAYTVRPGSLDAWAKRLREAGQSFDGPSERFGERMLALDAPDGLRVELIETVGDGPETATKADGFHSVTLNSARPDETARLLTDVFGYAHAGGSDEENGQRQRFRTPSDARATVVDILTPNQSQRGQSGAGTVHHIAFRAVDDAEQLYWRERLIGFGYQVTPVIDRQYFNAIYLREPGGILFEIATDPPGFAIDEDIETLGTSLKLPPQYEARRAEIEQALPRLAM